MEKSIEELTLLIMYLISWEEVGYVADEYNIPKEAKIKTCFKGEKLAKKLIYKYIK